MREIVRDALGDHVEVTGVHTSEGHVFFILHSQEWFSSIGVGIKEGTWFSHSREGKIKLIQAEVERLTSSSTGPPRE